jgi:hypothetical protein
MTLEKDVGIENLTRVIESIRAKITASEGRLEVKMAPKAVSQRDEADLQVRGSSISSGSGSVVWFAWVFVGCGRGSMYACMHLHACEMLDNKRKRLFEYTPQLA